MVGNMRRRAPWVNFAPTIYYSEGSTPVAQLWPDLALTLDTPIFYFRNQKLGAGPCAPASCPWGPRATEHAGGCLAGPCSESTAWNVVDEVDDMRRWLPPGRRLIVGFYATGHSSLGSPTARCVGRNSVCTVDKHQATSARARLCVCVYVWVHVFMCVRPRA